MTDENKRMPLLIIIRVSLEVNCTLIIVRYVFLPQANNKAVMFRRYRDKSKESRYEIHSASTWTSAQASPEWNKGNEGESVSSMEKNDKDWDENHG